MRPDLERPCVILDSHHPKEYLGIRELGRRCEAHGVRVHWTTRDKDVVVDLMKEDGCAPHVFTSARASLLGKVAELVVYDWKLAALATRVRPLAMVGKTITSAQVGRLLGIPSLLINDDDATANPQYRFLGYPFASRIISAQCMAESYGQRQRTYPGLMELAYLHPNAFTPDPGIRSELGVGPDERLFVIRRAAFSAYHDVGQRGLSRELVRALCERLRCHGRVYIVSEAPLEAEFEPLRLPLAASRLHHLLAACDLVIGDGLTVVVEAAVLGKPAIAFGSYIGKHGYTRALEKEFGLMHGYRPGQEAEMLACADTLLASPTTQEEWARRRRRMLSVWRDPTETYWEELLAVLDKRSSHRHRAATDDRRSGSSLPGPA